MKKVGFSLSKKAAGKDGPDKKVGWAVKASIYGYLFVMAALFFNQASISISKYLDMEASDGERISVPVVVVVATGVVVVVVSVAVAVAVAVADAVVVSVSVAVVVVVVVAVAVGLAVFVVVRGTN